MSGGLQRFFDDLYHGRSLGRWARLVDSSKTAPLSHLRKNLAQAWALRGYLDQVIHQAEYRLALPSIGSNAIRRPNGTDWAWRPEIWLGPLSKVGPGLVSNRTHIAEGATLFHDCTLSEVMARQVRNTRESDIAPFGFRMDFFRFDGTFLSLALDFPPEAIIGLKQKHIIRADLIVEMEKPLEIFARLNIKHGPNVETIVREVPLNHTDVMVEFDLGYSKMNEKRVEKIWIDLIFERPEMNQITLRDITFTRRHRAEL